MKTYKIRVNIVPHCVAIQKRAFELGYRWRNNGKTIQYNTKEDLVAEIYLR